MVHLVRTHSRYLRSLLVLSLLVLTACAANVSPFSPRAYEQATSLKVEALAIMGKATDPYSKHKAEVEALRLELDKAYEYARGRPKNDHSTAQWKFLRDPDRNLLGGFLKRWQASGQLSPVFVKEAQGLVSDAFDAIIELESGKRRAETK